MEGTHGQLGARLADGLGGDDTHRLAGAHRFADGQVDAVALGAHAAAGTAGQHGADLHLMDAVGLRTSAFSLRSMVSRVNRTSPVAGSTRSSAGSGRGCSAKVSMTWPCSSISATRMPSVVPQSPHG